MMKSQKLYESLFILHKCNTTITRLCNVISSSGMKISEIEAYVVLHINYINMEAVSFLDEFNGGFFHNIENEHKERMKEVRLITSPIIKQINKWKDLEKFRNNIVAHPWRHKGEFVIPDQQYYDIPRSWFEIVILVDLINYVWTITRAEFMTELDEAFIYVKSLKPSPKPASDYSKLNVQHKRMEEVVEQICKKLNKKYRLVVRKYLLENNEEP